ncbi:MAG: DUF1553 domain-containing protein [Phycisphaerae bacterium]|nr:DUF1553 domain-containing protein [Phycisphaerae bacterium]
MLFLAGAGVSFALMFGGPSAGQPQSAATPAVQFRPANFLLKGKWSSQTLLATQPDRTGAVRDVAEGVEFSVANPKVARVDRDGVVRPVGDGQTRIVATVRSGGVQVKAEATVRVEEVANDLIRFGSQIMPLIGRAGCANCHGGQNNGGMKLSLFGEEPAEDYAAIARQNRGLRINRIDPAKSLLLLKAAGTLPHAGGRKIAPDSDDYRMLLGWIAQGARFVQNDPKVVSLKVWPEQLVLAKGESRRVQATASRADGSEVDATREATFKCNGSAASVRNGVISAEGPGEAIVIVTYLRKPAVVRVIVPQPLQGEFPKLAANNRVDELVYARLRTLGVPPSALCSDPEFLRRVYLDTIGLLPTTREAEDFLADARADKRARLIDRLLARDEFADYWALKWGDLLRIKSEYPVKIWPKGAATYYRWVRQSIASNMPYDQFAREMLTATGSNFRVGPVNFVRAVSNKDPQTVGETAALLFMGARIGCARCHGHPTEDWTLDDNLAVGAFFGKVGYKATTEWKEEIVYFNPKGAVRDLRNGATIKPRFLGGASMDVPAEEDPRVRFADWLTAGDNPWFAPNICNRIWYWLVGRGIVEEPDDLRPTNPPSNPELLNFLAAELVRHAYDLKHIYRLVLNSRTYQLSSRSNQWNQYDAVNFSHYTPRRLGAEQLLDAICQVTETSETFASRIPEPYTKMPPGFRAIQLQDGNIESPILEMLGRPSRDTPYEADRGSRLTMEQTMYFLNAEHLENKIANSPRLKRLLESGKSDDRVIDELYLSTLCRRPTVAERAKASAHLGRDKKTRAQACQDVLWALLNSRDFLFDH